MTSPCLQRAGQAQRGKVVARGARLMILTGKIQSRAPRIQPRGLLASLGLVCCRGGSGRCNSFRGTGKFRMRCYWHHFNDCDSVSLSWRSSSVGRTLPTQLCSPKWGANHLDSQFRLLNFSAICENHEFGIGLAVEVHSSINNNNYPNSFWSWVVFLTLQSYRYLNTKSKKQTDNEK